MNRSPILFAATVFAGCCLIPSARADSFAYSIDGVPTTILTPSADTLSLTAHSFFLNLASGFNPGVYLQGSIFTCGDSSTLVQNVVTVLPSENLTIDGVTQSITLTVEDDVTQTEDVLHILPSAYDFNTVDGTFHVSFTDFASPPAVTYVGEQLTPSIVADITFTPGPTPEPFTMGLGIAGVGLAIRKRVKANTAN